MFNFLTRRLRREITHWRLEAQLQREVADAVMVSQVELRRNYEHRIADLKEARDREHTENMRTIKALADEVEYLRSQFFGTRTSAIAPAEIKSMPEPDFMPTASPLYVPEEIEDLRALRDSNKINELEYRRIYDQLSRATGLPIDVES